MTDIVRRQRLGVMYIWSFKNRSLKNGLKRLKKEGFIVQKPAVSMQKPTVSSADNPVKTRYSIGTDWTN